MSGSGAFAGRLRFCGYGITAPEAHWDDFAAGDLKGMVAVIPARCPGEQVSGGPARVFRPALQGVERPRSTAPLQWPSLTCPATAYRA